MTLRMLLMVLGILFITYDNGFALTRVVPTQYPTIQLGIWASSNGDSVVVLPGTYVENIVINRNIVLRSTGGPAATVIKGSSPLNPDSASVVRIHNGSIEGFDICNGTGTITELNERTGGGILILGPANIRGNWIHDNTIVWPRATGAAIRRIDGVATIANNRIFNNRIEATNFGYGAGVYCSQDIVINNEVYGNHVIGGSNAGIHTSGLVRQNIIACNTVDGPDFSIRTTALYARTRVEGNTIVGNFSSAAIPAVVIYVERQEPPADLISNNIVFNTGPAVLCSTGAMGQVNFLCNNIYGNTGGTIVGTCADPIGEDGNISVEPEFGIGTCPHQSGYWCLDQGSPLLPPNSPPGCGVIGAVGACPPIGVADNGTPTAAMDHISGAPNPFSERTGIEFYLARPDEVSITIVTAPGRVIRTLNAGWMSDGGHRMEWDGRMEGGSRAPSGAYVAVIRIGNTEVTRTLLLVR